jgi:hypothetical protein
MARPAGARAFCELFNDVDKFDVKTLSGEPKTPPPTT